jgi:hypothetical protein
MQQVDPIIDDGNLEMGSFLGLGTGTDQILVRQGLFSDRPRFRGEGETRPAAHTSPATASARTEARLGPAFPHPVPRFLTLSP